jgi:hypothetical protein
MPGELRIPQRGQYISTMPQLFDQPKLKIALSAASPIMLINPMQP